MKIITLLGLVVMVVMWTDGVNAIPGDVNCDGIVNFDDFFLLADNFGQEGPPEIIDTVEVMKYDTLTVEVQHVTYDTLEIEHVTLFDTIIYGREPIRYDPAPGPSEISQAQEMRSSFITRAYSSEIVGEITNQSSTSLKYITLRLTVRNPDEVVIYTKKESYAVYRLIAGDTRGFTMDFYSLSDDVTDNLRAGNYALEVTWSEEIEQVNNVSLQIKPNSLTYATPFAITGEIENSTDLTVSSYTISFYGRDANGKPIYLKSTSESTFGISPGGTSPFTISSVYLGDSTYLSRDDIAELYYYIDWQWTTSSYDELEVSPLTRVF